MQKIIYNDNNDNNINNKQHFSLIKMPMDEYDNTVADFDEIINIRGGDDANIETIIADFMNKVVPQNANTIVINYQTFNQTEQAEKLKKRIQETIKTLNNALSVLDSRTITTIGGKVAHYVVPEQYDTELGFRPKWYHVQVWR